MKKGIVLIGAAILDVLVRPADRSVFDTGSYPAEDIRLSFGGDALNEASVLAAMGKQVVLHTVLGRDPAGDMIRDYCGRLGIKLGPFAQEEPDGQKGESVLQVPTGINVVLVEEDGERSFLTNKNGSLRGLALSHIPLPFPKDTGIVSLASIFVSPRLSCKDMALLFQAVAGQGSLVCADMTKPKNKERVADIAGALALVDYLFPNREEACLVTGKETVEEAAEALLQAGVGCVVIKCGGQGCYVREGRPHRAERNRRKAYRPDRESDQYSEENWPGDSQGFQEGYYVPAASVKKIVDTTGAGDSFVSGFLYGLSEGWEVRRCAEFANECGAKAVQRIGAVEWLRDGVR